MSAPAPTRRVVALGVIVFAVIYGIILGRRDPELVQRIGSYVADEEF